MFKLSVISKMCMVLCFEVQNFKYFLGLRIKGNPPGSEILYYLRTKFVDWILCISLERGGGRQSSKIQKAMEK